VELFIQWQNLRRGYFFRVSFFGGGGDVQFEVNAYVKFLENPFSQNEFLHVSSQWQSHKLY
jgi:hypothetical protein